MRNGEAYILQPINYVLESTHIIRGLVQTIFGKINVIVTLGGRGHRP